MRKSSMEKAGRALEAVADELKAFNPTPEMRKVKSTIMARLKDDPVHVPGSLLSRSTAEHLAGRSLESWYGQQGFQEWLSNSTEFQDRLEGLAMQAMDTLEEIMYSGSQDSARVNAAKVAMELASKFPRQKAEEGNPFEGMEKDKLIALFSRYAPKLLEGSQSGKKEEK